MLGFSPLGIDPLGLPPAPYGAGSTFSVDVPGIPSSLSIGAPSLGFTVPAPFSVAPSGVASTLNFGTPAFSFSGPSAFSVAVPGIASTLAIGVPSFQFQGDDTISTLVVEDGSGMQDADTYASVATADAYHASRGNSAWALLTTAMKDVKLRMATDYLQAKYSGGWKGYRVTALQALDWPRYGVTVDRVTLVSDQLPVQLVRACCELALKAIDGPLTADEGAQVKAEKVGQIEVTYADGARQQTRFASVESMLRPLLQGGLNTLQVRRA